MAIAVPSLDDRAYADLVEEARGLIPVYDPSWTNHNASDPGITLIELFAWLTEMQIYALDQITDEHRVTFLRLLNGPHLKPTRNDDRTIDKVWLEEETTRTFHLLRQTTRAVSARDHEELACRVPGVRRAQCVPRRNLEAGSEDARLAPADGHVSLVIVPDKELVIVPDKKPDEQWNDAAARQVCAEVHESLKPARMLTTRLHVVPPTFVPVATRIVVARRFDSKPDELETRIRARLTGWLSAWTGGGDDGEGWRFGRDVYVSELNAVLEAVRGVDNIGDAKLSSAAADKPQELSAKPIWHDSGALVGLALAPHRLPRSAPAWHEILIGNSVEAVDITVNVTPGTGSPADIRRIVLQTVMDDLWKLQRDKQRDGFDLSAGYIMNMLKTSPQVEAVVSIDTITMTANRALFSKATDVYTFAPGQLLQTTCAIVVAGAAS